MNNKTNLTIASCITIIGLLFSFSPNPYEDALLFIGDSERVLHYRYQNNMGDEEFYTGHKKVIGGKEYMEKKIRSVSGKETLQYCRKGLFNFYIFNKKTKSEGIIIPISPKMGEVWVSADKGTKYEIVALDQRFRTPVKKYKSSIWIKCTAHDNPYGIERSKKYLHYVKGEGLVAITDTKGDFVKYLTGIDD